MRRTFIFIGIVSFLLAGFGSALVWQKQAATTARVEIAYLRDQQKEGARLKSENDRLRKVRVSAVELESLRGDREALARLRGEIEALRRRADDPARLKAIKTEVPVAPGESILETPVRASAWRDAGTGTPGATLETVLWAAAGGDVDKLAGLLVFDPGARAQAEALLAGLPKAMRAEYDTPERLIAVLTAKDVPLGMAQIFDQKIEDVSGRRVVVNLTPTVGSGSKLVAVSLHQQDGVWKLGVPVSAVAKYAAALKGTTSGK